VAGPTEIAAMRRALELAARGPLRGGNPRVGCVVLDSTGAVVGEGYHRGRGTAHAEVDALAAAGPAARGATAVVTLEPCAHTSLTGPCTQALLDAGIARVVAAIADPNPVAGGGADLLRAAGVDVELGVLEAESQALNRRWLHAIVRGRPFVTWKFAATLDGRSAAADGSSRWITGEAARQDVHRLRAEADAVLVGTGTALADDPSLTVRSADGSTAREQPLRVVVGLRELPPGARLLDGVEGAAPTLHLRTRDVHQVLKELGSRTIRSVWLEGGPRLAAAFLAEGLVDEVIAYMAPALLGAGPAAVADLGVASITDALRLQVRDVRLVGGDVRISAVPTGVVPTGAVPTTADPTTADPTPTSFERQA
jgi:diaminohydroxyphosphoribosylaminopyrimidine deaminase/5-amino-6-(5-phosphoribosylamino)uracil reductase